MLSSNILIGAHTSTNGGLPQALWEGKKIGAKVVQLFTSNQKQWQGRILTPQIIKEWQAAREETQLTHLMSHDSYLINLGGPRLDILEKSRQAFQEEIKRCIALKISYLNFHPGSALTDNLQKCLDCIVESILLMRPYLDQGHLRLLLETTAGQGTTVGYCFEHLNYIIEAVKKYVPIGVCMDTCHIFVAGYDIRTPQAFENTLVQFDQTIGIEHLYAFHLNDSTKGLGSRVDRHQSLGEGMIGWDCFKFLMTDSRTKDLPKYLETPQKAQWVQEIQKLKEFALNPLPIT